MWSLPSTAAGLLPKGAGIKYKGAKKGDMAVMPNSIKKLLRSNGECLKTVGKHHKNVIYVPGIKNYTKHLNFPTRQLIHRVIGGVKCSLSTAVDTTEF